MKYPALIVALVILFASTSTVEAADDKAAVYREILESKAGSLVTVKFVLKIKISYMGQVQEQESNLEVTGVVVDKGGLIMIASDALNPGLGMGVPDEVEISASHSNLKILFEDDDEEYDAILGATDSNLNLSFLQIKDLKGKEIVPVEFSKAAQIEIGQEYIGISRFTKGFDYVPYFGTVRVCGTIYQPRPMFSVISTFDGTGLPVFDFSGKVAGVMSTQKGSEGTSDRGGGMLRLAMEGDSGAFLIPAPTVHATLQRAIKIAREALKKDSEESGESESEGDGE